MTQINYLQILSSYEKSYLEDTRRISFHSINIQIFFLLYLHLAYEPSSFIDQWIMMEELK